MTYSAIQFNANALYQAVNQTAHGFTTPGVIVRFNGTDFVLADATTDLNAQVVGMISNIPTVDSFYITQEGFVSGLTTTPTEGGTYIPGNLYYLSQTPGELTSIVPTIAGEVLLPCFIAYTSTSGFFFASVGEVIGAEPINFRVVTTDTVMVPFTEYSTNSGSTLMMSLPTTLSVGDEFIVSSQDTGGFRIVQSTAIQSIIIGTNNTTFGVGGYIEAAYEGASVTLRCVVSDGLSQELLVTNTEGSFTGV